MSSEINLTGGEIALLKQIGLSGGQQYGKILLSRIERDDAGEFLDTLRGLLDQGYIVSNRVNIRVIEDVETAFFRANPAQIVELRDAMHPSRRRERERTEQQQRRRRRR